MTPEEAPGTRRSRSSKRQPEAPIGDPLTIIQEIRKAEPEISAALTSIETMLTPKPVVPSDSIQIQWVGDVSECVLSEGAPTPKYHQTSPVIVCHDGTAHLLATDQNVMAFVVCSVNDGKQEMALSVPVCLPNAAAREAEANYDSAKHTVAFSPSANQFYTQSHTWTPQPQALPLPPYELAAPDSWNGYRWVPVSVHQLADAANAVAGEMVPDASNPGKFEPATDRVLLGIPEKLDANLVVVGKGGAAVIAGCKLIKHCDEILGVATNHANYEDKVIAHLRKHVDKVLTHLVNQRHPAGTPEHTEAMARITRRMTELSGSDRQLAADMEADIKAERAPAPVPAASPLQPQQHVSWQSPAPSTPVPQTPAPAPETEYAPGTVKWQ